jgi:hypothetical protein
VTSVHSHDERKPAARVHVRSSIQKEANNRERAVVRGDAQGLRVGTGKSSVSSRLRANGHSPHLM